MTSAARASSVGGNSRPIALAALRLTTNSNLVGKPTVTLLYRQSNFTKLGLDLFIGHRMTMRHIGEDLLWCNASHQRDKALRLIDANPSQIAFDTAFAGRN
jgi:hypothetical protein